MKEIKFITVLKEGFYIRAKDIERDSSSGLYYNYLLKFNDIDNHDFVRHIAEYTKSKPKGEIRKCPGENLVSVYGNDASTYKKVLRKCIEDPSRDKLDRPFGPKTLFVIYHIDSDDLPRKINDSEDRKKFYFETFIHKEKGGGKDKKENLLFGLGDCNTTDIKFEMGKSISDYGVSLSRDRENEKLRNENKLKSLQQSDSIFSDEFQEYVRFESRTEDLDQGILSVQRGFKVKNTKHFKRYMKRGDHKYESSITKLINEGKNVLIKGSPKVGKTRLAFEVLNNLNDYYVFSLFQDYWPEIEKLKFSDLTNKKKMRTIWFIDDLHFFHENTQKMYDKLIANFDDVIVVATLQSGKKLPDIPLTKYLEEITISVWLEDELKELATQNSIPIKYQITNTPLSLIKNFSYLIKNYKIYKDSEEKIHCLHVLYYLKLLYELVESIDYQLFEDVFIFLRKGLSNKDNLRSALAEVEHIGFIEMSDGCISSWEIFFTEIVFDQDYYDMINDMERLIPLFIDRKMDGVLNILGHYFATKKHFDTALDIFNKLIQLSPKLHVAYHNRSFVYSKKGEDDLAAKDSTEAFRLNPYPDTHTNYIKNTAILLMNKEYDLVIKKCTESIEIDPLFHEIYCNRGIAYRYKDECDLAIKDFTEAIRLHQNYHKAYFHRGYTYYKNDKYDLAIKDCTKAIKIVPNDANYYYFRGYFYYKNDKYDLAIKDYTKAIKIDSSCINAYILRGTAYGIKEEYDLAIKDYTKAIKIVPNEPPIYYERGVVYFKKGKYDLAINDFTETIKLDHKYINAYLKRAFIYEKKGEFDLAIKDLTETIKIDPNYKKVYYNLSCFYALQKNKSKMLLNLKKAIKFNPTDNKKAKADNDFKEYWDDSDFKKIVN